MHHVLLVGVILLVSSQALAEWHPPEKPDPSEILTEAQRDAHAGRYEDALAKHVWYHEHALKHQPTLSGVRRSFALRYWMELGEKYPPALVKLESFRQLARKQVLRNKNVEDNFMDFAAISGRVKKDKEIIDLFIALDEKHPKSAERVYPRVDDALIAAKKFKLCGKYIDGDKVIALLIRRFEHNRELAKDPRHPVADIGEFGEKTFRQEAAMIVAILVKCDRETEAKRVAATARAAWDDAELNAALDKALEGDLPGRDD